MKNNNTRRNVLLKLSGVSALTVWHKPLINSVLTPAHAQMSPLDPPVDPPVDPVPLDPADVCPMIVIGNVLPGPVSGTSAVPVCQVTFEVLSADAATPITIISIDAGTLPADTTIDIQDIGEATDALGPRVVWRGPATDAPFCMDIQPLADVTFTVTATCTAVTSDDLNMGEYQQTFLLSDIVS